jgi:hypothetical protein
MSIKESEKISTASNDTELSDQDLAIVIGGGEGTLLKIEGTKGESADDKHRDAIHIGSFVQKP